MKSNASFILFASHFYRSFTLWHRYITMIFFSILAQKYLFYHRFNSCSMMSSSDDQRYTKIQCVCVRNKDMGWIVRVCCGLYCDMYCTAMSFLFFFKWFSLVVINKNNICILMAHCCWCVHLKCEFFFQMKWNKCDDYPKQK